MNYISMVKVKQRLVNDEMTGCSMAGTPVFRRGPFKIAPDVVTPEPSTNGNHGGTERPARYTLPAVSPENRWIRRLSAVCNAATLP